MTLINELLEKAENAVSGKDKLLMRTNYSSHPSTYFSNTFGRAVIFINGIQDKPVPIQICIGSAAGWITGYVFTKGSKIVAEPFITITNIITSQMDQSSERATNLIAAIKPYIHYVVLPVGLYAANRFFRFLIPGPQHRSKLDLRDRAVLITGASSGLGRELAICFYRRGAKVILTARSIDKLKELCEELKSLQDVINNNEPVYKYLDITDPNGVVELVSFAINQRIDVLINNAGLSMRGSCKDTSMDVHRQVMEVNYFGHVAITKALLDYIPEDGAIVYISSVQGRIAVPYRSSYSASKHAAQAFFDCLRTEERFKTQILVVSATYLNTGFGRRALTTEGKPMDKDDLNQANGLTPSYAAECIINALINRNTELILAPLSHRFAIFLQTLLIGNGKFQFCNSRGYIKINQSKLRRDIERLRKDITRVTSNRSSVAEGEVNDFLRNNAYLLGSYGAGFLLGYTFA
ncbi:Dehydrogenases, short chain protein 30, putative [Brugia malayi]|uniref:Dehydrogenases, short chain protein 30, putative n=1 Tax=Brugia malayi TaxID=6279 RepID=A0A4E9F599_BRUMA|nr:Dehydrogenases, short chain protein 30, putative [Brugia malayi]VIO89401.1 Dehydrogenases, short chain protein 30, putative [Brugia malayi]